MPRGDGTGPWGAGPMTGRGAGFCAGANVPGYASGGAWRGGARGRGGHGYRNQFYATGLTGWQRGVRGPALGAASSAAPYAPEFTRADEVSDLRTQAEGLEKALSDVRARLAELEGAED